MYHIEVLPTTGKETSTPGWAYVPDTGIDPSKLPIVPSGARKRARISYIDERAAPVSSFSHSQSQYQGNGQGQGQGQTDRLSAREQSRIQMRLAELDRENYRDIKIEVPNKPKDVAQRGLRPGRPMSAGVRKILGSMKSWGNYLDDEGVRLAAAKGREELVGEAVRVSGVGGEGVGEGQGKGARRRSLAGGAEQGEAEDGAEEATEDAMGVNDTQPAPDDQQQQQQPPQSTPSRSTDQSALPPDIAALINPSVPKMPSEEEIEILLRQPPLSYNQARAGPSMSTAPPRQFCEICGYWGRVRCMKCGQRVCGLECLRAHEDARCLKFYA